jgi:ABC-type multidrug transport system permease subunit
MEKTSRGLSVSMGRCGGESVAFLSVSYLVGVLVYTEAASGCGVFQVNYSLFL